MKIKPFDLSPDQSERIRLSYADPDQIENTDIKIINISLESLWLSKNVYKPSKEAFVHLAFAKAHCRGEFTDDVPDAKSALYHLYRAARGGVLEAIIALAEFHSGLGTDSSEFLPVGGESVCDSNNDLA